MLMEKRKTKECEMKPESVTIQKIEVTEPPLYKVVFLNDDVTPMEFVVVILKDLFNYSETIAKVKMLQIHNEGSAIIGVYSYAIAETKKVLTDNFSRKYGYPLTVKIEENK